MSDSFSKWTVREPWTDLEPYMTAKHSFLHEDDRKTLKKLFKSLLEPGFIKVKGKHHIDDMQKLRDLLICPTGTTKRTNADNTHYPFTVDEFIQTHPTVWARIGLNDSHFEMLKSLETGLNATLATLTASERSRVIGWLVRLSQNLSMEPLNRHYYDASAATYAQNPSKPPKFDGNKDDSLWYEPENFAPAEKPAAGTKSLDGGSNKTASTAALTDDSMMREAPTDEFLCSDTMALFHSTLGRLEEYAQELDQFKFKQVKSLLSCAWRATTYTDHGGQKLPYTVSKYYGKYPWDWLEWGLEHDDLKTSKTLEKLLNEQFPHHTSERGRTMAWMTQETDKVQAKYHDHMLSKTKKLHEANRREDEALANWRLEDSLKTTKPKRDLHDVQQAPTPSGSQVEANDVQTQPAAETDIIANKFPGASPGQATTQDTVGCSK